MSNGTDTTTCIPTVYCTQAHQSVLTILIVIQLSNCFCFSSKPRRDVEYVSYVYICVFKYGMKAVIQNLRTYRLNTIC